LKQVKDDVIFDGFNPHEDVYISKTQIKVDQKKLDRLEKRYNKKGIEMSNKLRLAIDDERDYL